MPTANVLDDDGVAVHGPPNGVDGTGAAAGPSLVVGRALEKGGKTTGDVRPEHVHVGHGPVAKRQGNMRLKLHRVSVSHFLLLGAGLLGPMKQLSFRARLLLFRGSARNLVVLSTQCSTGRNKQQLE